MAESKRIFSRGKMNRDIDDRLLPEGEYRDALNVNVGKSEGGDIGAVENLKGNELVSGQSGIIGTTIGVIRDPNDDRVYWFNTSDTVDAVYEYDQSTNTVTPIISDTKARTAPLPTCAPDTRATITEPDGNPPVRPAFNALPAPPLGYCGSTSQFAQNSGMRSDGTAADVSYDYIDNSICTFDPSFVCNMITFNCEQVNDGSGTTQGACQSVCVDPNPPQPPASTTLTVAGCPSGAVDPVANPTVDLTLTATNFDAGDFPMDVSVSNGGTVTLTGNGSAVTFTVSAGTGQVAYTPSGADNNIGCTIGWGVAPPAASFICLDNNTANARCEDPGDGSGMSFVDCSANCNQPAANIGCTNWTASNPAGNNNVLRFYVSCPTASPNQQNCTLFMENIAAGATSTRCIPDNVTTYCSNDPIAGVAPAAGATFTGFAVQLITDTLGRTGTAVTTMATLTNAGSCS